jgi:hypothetical protein
MEVAMVTLDFEHDGRVFQIRSHVRTTDPSRVEAFMFEQDLFIPGCSAGYGASGNDPGAVTNMMEAFRTRVTSGILKPRAGVAVEILQ